jgi:hypothetical protein
MKKITISENCFGVDVEIDDESLFTHEYEKRTPEYVSVLQDKMVDKLKSLKDKLSMSDWVDIANIIIDKADEFEFDVENSKDYQSCDQCGNWNYNHIYVKKEKNNE